jgi:hypothetical protein
MPSSEIERTTALAFGYNYAELPDPPPVALWGARLIAPDDLVYDRQCMTGTEEGKRALAEWLDPSPEGYGGIQAMKEWLAGLDRDFRLHGSKWEEHRFEDEYGVIVANTNKSYGYVYVVGWRK